MNDQLQTQLSGPYFSSFSAHSYSYELSNEPKSVLKLLDFRFGPILRQTPHNRQPCLKSYRIINLNFIYDTGVNYE